MQASGLQICRDATCAGGLWPGGGLILGFFPSRCFRVHSSSDLMHTTASGGEYPYLPTLALRSAGHCVSACVSARMLSLATPLTLARRAAACKGVGVVSVGRQIWPFKACMQYAHLYSDGCSAARLALAARLPVSQPRRLQAGGHQTCDL